MTRRVPLTLGAILTAGFLPSMASADTTFTDLLIAAGHILDMLVGVFIAIAIAVFFWGLVKYFWGASTENAQEGIRLMFWGVIAIFVMVSIWGILRLIQGSLDIDNGAAVRPKGYFETSVAPAGGSIKRPPPPRKDTTILI